MANTTNPDLAIARAASPRPIVEIGKKLGIPPDALFSYGQHKAKLSLPFTHGLEQRGDGKLILMTAITPTRAGEGKTTTTVGLGDALNQLGHQAAVCLREPSLGPCFGMKGGAAGGGYAQVLPMEDINLHFTGDTHAISTAHNLLATLIDNHIHWGNALNIDPRRVTWRRALDLNDRALRDIVVALGGVNNGLPHETGFVLTAASETMAIFCLARDLQDLERRLGNIIIGASYKRMPVRASDLNAQGAMTALLRDALMPNLVQTLEHNPAFIHGGPFANIAHGCNSVIATRTALKLADYVVTEAGFGADLGAEKFFDIKCRKAGLHPDVAVLVATVRALKVHGGLPLEAHQGEDVAAVEHGLGNLGRHIRNIAHFGVPVVVAINRFDADSDAECAAIRSYCTRFGIKAAECTHWSDGGKGALELAEAVVSLGEGAAAQFRPLYEDQVSLWEKTQLIARSLYGADDVVADEKVFAKFARFEAEGFGEFPVCMAKTQFSFSTDPKKIGAAYSHVIPVRDVQLSAGAEFIVVVCGDILDMPGLPKKPSAEMIGVNSQGEIEGLF